MIPRVAPVRADERWRQGLGARRLSGFAIAVVAVSLVLHAALLAIALLGTKAEAAPPQETPVEVVQEVPPAEVPKRPPPQATKQPAPRAPTPPEPVAAKPPPPPPPAKADTQRAELERQLDELKAEQQAQLNELKAERQAQLDELKAEQQVLRSEAAGLGPLRDSIHAVALPAEGGGGDGELVGYQSLVFSQLAKAKEGAHEAAKPATVGVRFSVDDNGALADVAVAVSSGVADLDAESLAIVRRAAPFPKPPAGAEHTFSANFAYAGSQR